MASSRGQNGSPCVCPRQSLTFTLNSTWSVVGKIQQSFYFLQVCRRYPGTPSDSNDVYRILLIFLVTMMLLFVGRTTWFKMNQAFGGHQAIRTSFWPKSVGHLAVFRVTYKFCERFTGKKTRLWGVNEIMDWGHSRTAVDSITIVEECEIRLN